MKQDECCYPWAVPIRLFIIDKHNNNQSAFAKSQGVSPQQVTKWLNMGCVVVNGTLYSPRRELKGEEYE